MLFQYASFLVLGSCGSRFGRRLVYSLMGLTLAFTTRNGAADDSVRGLVKDKPTGVSVRVDGEFMVPYVERIPGTDLRFEMVPIPGGTFKFGSPDNEVGRAADEGPRVTVVADPMWIGKTEVTWGEFRQFLSLLQVFRDQRATDRDRSVDLNQFDAVTAPSEIGDPSFTFERGDDPRLPAVTMTLYTAQQYTKWLSRIVGRQYRLPTEAEWEYAARAGSGTAYSWGSTAVSIHDYACYAENSVDGPAVVASRKPNAFGLHDMHGNVAEYTISRYSALGHQWLLPVTGTNAVSASRWVTDGAFSSVRGGGWMSTAAEVRSASRLGVREDDWKAEDPQDPLSPWWCTDRPSQAVGFRVVRSYQPLGVRQISPFWETNSGDVRANVRGKVNRGIGAAGLVTEGIRSGNAVGAE